MGGGDVAASTPPGLLMDHNVDLPCTCARPGSGGRVESSQVKSNQIVGLRDRVAGSSGPSASPPLSLERVSRIYT